MSGPESSPASGSGPVTLRYGAASDVGLVRETNEDSYLTAPPVFVVADGMGGHDGGEVASGIAVEELARLGDATYDAAGARQAVLTTLAACQRRLAAYAAGHRGRTGGRWHGGTTTVAAFLVEEPEGPRWLLANLGDSRGYRFAAGELHRVSTDHSVVQELVDCGRISPEEAVGHPERHVVTRALFEADPLEPDFYDVPLVDGERILLCSDGITDLVRDDAIARVLADHDDPGEAATALVAVALEAGGIDNATAVVVDVVGWPDQGRDDSRRGGSLHENQGVLP